MSDEGNWTMDSGWPMDVFTPAGLLRGAAAARAAAEDDVSGYMFGIGYGVVLAQFGMVLFAIKGGKGFSPDEACCAIEGISRRDLFTDPWFRLRLVGLVLRRDGTFFVHYLVSHNTLGKGGKPTGLWSHLTNDSCDVTPPAAYELLQWFDTCQKMRLLQQDGLA